MLVALAPCTDSSLTVSACTPVSPVLSQESVAAQDFWLVSQAEDTPADPPSTYSDSDFTPSPPEPPWPETAIVTGPLTAGPPVTVSAADALVAAAGTAATPATRTDVKGNNGNSGRPATRIWSSSPTVRLA